MGNVVTVISSDRSTEKVQGREGKGMQVRGPNIYPFEVKD